MSGSNLSLKDQIESAQVRIASRFIEQCTQGKQTTSLPQNAAACGQFLGDDAIHNSQRGLHGTAAAIQVLARHGNEPARELVPKLVEYVQNRDILESANHALAEKAKGDRRNVIKISEVLYALSFVQTGLSAKDKLVAELADSLRKCKITGSGWGYFIGEAIAQPLPTCYAILGLCRCGYDVTDTAKYLLTASAKLGVGSTQQHKQQHDLTIATLTLYALTYSGLKLSDADNRQAQATFRRLWRHLEPMLAWDIEQNIAYWHSTENHYVRLPWQLYLFALSSQYSRWRFSSVLLQVRLRTLLAAVIKDEFFYPHSEGITSARTYSIAYDCLDVVRRSLETRRVMRVAIIWDTIRRFFGRRWLRVLLMIILVGFMFAIVIRWSITSDDPVEVAPELIGIGLTSLLSLLGKRE